MLKKINSKVAAQILVGLAFYFVIVLISYWLGLEVIGRDRLDYFVRSAGVFGPLVIILVKASTLVFAPLGGGPIYILSGLIYGFWVAFLLTWVGDIFGSVVAFWIARKLGREVVLRFSGSKSARSIDKLYEKVGEWRILLVASVIPISDLVNYAAGLTPVAFWQFLLIVLFSRIIIDSFFVSLALFPEAALFLKLGYGLVIVVYVILAAIIWKRLFKR